jgi:hypothetical protein
MEDGGVQYLRNDNTGGGGDDDDDDGALARFARFARFRNWTLVTTSVFADAAAGAGGRGGRWRAPSGLNRTAPSCARLARGLAADCFVGDADGNVTAWVASANAANWR